MLDDQLGRELASRLDLALALLLGQMLEKKSVWELDQQWEISLDYVMDRAKAKSLELQRDLELESALDPLMG